MKLFSPWGLLGLLAIPPFVLMYILKQNLKEHKVPSLYLWNEVLKNTKATKPWDKFRKNLLFFIQLIALLLLIFALTTPFINFKGSDYENVIIVIDNTGSMNAKIDGESRLEQSKDKAKETIKKLSPSTAIALVTSGKNTKVELSSVKNKDEVLNKLNNIKSNNETGDINESLSLVKAMTKNYKSYKVIYFSDSKVNLEGINGELVYVGNRGENVSLNYINTSIVNGELKALIRATNFSEGKLNRNISLYADGKITGVKTVDINPLEIKTIYFDNIPKNTKYIMGEIKEEDALSEDNKIYNIVKQDNKSKVILYSDKNTFLEKSISHLNWVELYKGKKDDALTDDYNLYIFDNYMPKDLPKRGNILFISPDGKNEFFNVEEEIKGDVAKAVEGSFSRFLENTSFSVSKFKKIEKPSWATSVLKVGGNEGAFLGEKNGRRVGVISFYLQNSDFPLTTEFPIFISNTLSYLTDRNQSMLSSYSCGDMVEISPLPDTEKLQIIKPSKDKLSLELTGGVKNFTSTNEIGIYDVVQNSKAGDVKTSFTVSFPKEESNINKEGKQESNVFSNKTGIAGLNIRDYLIIIAILIVLVEWYVHRKGDKLWG